MKDILPGYILEDKYIQAVLGNDIYGVYNYWKSEAEEAEKAGRHVEAYLYWYKAGWDEHTYDHMENILEGLVRNAQKAGYDALYQIGLYHQRSLS
ncbi:MAG: hypothetical protein JW860_11835 [Sedimentisphaerales bacterium]|nr:hypothetical protein [Sedimentisphaerales bacterium]